MLQQRFFSTSVHSYVVQTRLAQDAWCLLKKLVQKPRGATRKQGTPGITRRRIAGTFRSGDVDLKIDPIYDSVRGDPRFRKLLADLKLD